MKICFYSPYLGKHFGGGEKYILDCAKILADLGHQVDVILDSETSDIEMKREEYELFLGTKLNQINFIHGPFDQKKSFIKKLLFTKNYDIFYHLTDGSLILSLAKRNILHIQIPFSASSWKRINDWKIKSYQVINTNSKFTKSIIQQNWPIKVTHVHEPYVDMVAKPNMKKEKIILNVGRFFSYLHSKRQDVIIDIFKLCLDEYKELKQFKLVLIGKNEDQAFLDELMDKAKGHNIDIITNINRKKLIEYYQKAMIYVHATGFGLDEGVHPSKMEHFGISTLEAMSYGVVPVVINKGGQKEIMGDQLSSLLFDNKQQAKQIIYQLITNNSRYNKFQKLALSRADNYSQDKFTKTLLKMTRLA